MSENDKQIRIALTGKMRSGKDTVASILETDYGLNRTAFGDEIKRLAHDLFKDSEIYPTEYGKNIIGLSYEKKPRKLLQDLGQAMRALDDAVWIRQVERWVDFYEQFKTCKGVVISDLRQPNEFEWARDNSFVVIRVNAGEHTRIERIESSGDDYSEKDLRHETEQSVDDFEVDYEINNGEGVDLTELKRQVDEIVDEITSEREGD